MRKHSLTDVMARYQREPANRSGRWTNGRRRRQVWTSCSTSSKKQHTATYVNPPSYVWHRLIQPSHGRKREKREQVIRQKPMELGSAHKKRCGGHILVHHGHHAEAHGANAHAPPANQNPDQCTTCCIITTPGPAKLTGAASGIPRTVSNRTPAESSWRSSPCPNRHRRCQNLHGRSYLYKSMA